MGLSGSGTAAAKALAQRFRTLKVDSKLTRPMAAKAAELALADFDAQRDPMGGAWVSGPYVSSPMLQKSKALRGSIQGASTNASFSVRARARHAWFHQRGAELRDAPPKRFRRRVRVGPGRNKSGPKQKLTRSGPAMKGRLRGFLPARPLLPPPGRMSARWERQLGTVAHARLRAHLGI